MLHFIPDDAVAYASVRTLRGAMCPGSYLMISHSTTDGLPLEVVMETGGIVLQSFCKIRGPVWRIPHCKGINSEDAAQFYRKGGTLSATWT
ncbi:MAG: SAM-dependent methyltransferase [Herpetosiphonaceae bacterium]|nr:SAM-dependent methyltransferase [Herpetosiphonaceae bacterium]